LVGVVLENILVGVVLETCVWEALDVSGRGTAPAKPAPVVGSFVMSVVGPPEGAWEVVSLHDMEMPSIRTERRRAAANMRAGSDHPTKPRLT
jgi:hypothetical protein